MDTCTIYAEPYDSTVTVLHSQVCGIVKRHRIIIRIRNAYHHSNLQLVSLTQRQQNHNDLIIHILLCKALLCYQYSINNFLFGVKISVDMCTRTNNQLEIYRVSKYHNKIDSILLQSMKRVSQISRYCDVDVYMIQFN